MLLYVIEFPNGMRYFGITDRSLAVRWADHLADSRRKTKRPICIALAKYPGATIRTLVVGTCDYIHDLETKAIEAFRTADREFGYNVGLGGDFNPMLGRRHTPEALAKIGAASRARVRTAETKAKISASLKGHSVSAETRAKLRASIGRPEVRARITGRPRKSVSISVIPGFS